MTRSGSVTARPHPGHTSAPCGMFSGQLPHGTLTVLMSASYRDAARGSLAEVERDGGPGGAQRDDSPRQGAVVAEVGEPHERPFLAPLGILRGLGVVLVDELEACGRDVDAPQAPEGGPVEVLLAREDEGWRRVLHVVDRAQD